MSDAARESQLADELEATIPHHVSGVDVIARAVAALRSKASVRPTREHMAFEIMQAGLHAKDDVERRAWAQRIWDRTEQDDTAWRMQQGRKSRSERGEWTNLSKESALRSADAVLALLNGESP